MPELVLRPFLMTPRKHPLDSDSWLSGRLVGPVPDLLAVADRDTLRLCKTESNFGNELESKRSFLTMLSNCKYICVLLVGILASRPAVAANWGHWRGEAGNGVSTTARPPVKWSTTENVKWKVELPGRGSGSPVIWNDKVFVVTAVAAGGGRQVDASLPSKLQFIVICFDRETGKTLWKQTAIEAVPHEGTHSTNGFASASPCTDGKFVYAHFGSRGLYCYTLDGELVWKRDLGRMSTRNGFGEGSSPTLVDDKIIVPWDHEGQSFLFALNKTTGDTIWKVERDEPTCWATPLIVGDGDSRQVIMNGQNSARAYDLKTGKELWKCAGQTQRPVASPVAGHGLIFIGSGHRGSFLGAFRSDGIGNIEGTSKVVWTVSRDTPDLASLLLSESRLYYCKGKSGLVSCVDAKTGKPFYSTQRTGLNTLYASPVAAGGVVYLSDRDGKTVVIKDSEEFEIIATNSLGETIDATPAPVDGELFIRGERHLYCISE